MIMSRTDSSHQASKVTWHKNDVKSSIETKYVVAVVVGILLLFTILIPYGFYNADGYLGAIYSKSPQQSNATHIFVDPATKRYIKIELDREQEVLRPTDENHQKYQQGNVSIQSLDGTGISLPLLSRHKRDKSPGVKYTEAQQEQVDAYEAYIKCIEERTEKYFEEMAMKPSVVLGEEDSPITLKCNMW